MCGFVASQNYNTLHKQMEQAISLVSHRGPDSLNILYQHNSLHYMPVTYFAHARLAITGIENGIQPLISNNKQIFCLVNGEFYNYKEVKKSLEHEGYLFTTNTDSEIVPALYEKYGMSFIDHLEGEFSLAIYDNIKDIWILARDPFGTKPLCWTFNQLGLFIASEAKSLSPFAKLELDQDALFFSQNFQYLPQGKTFFKNIHMCRPGMMMVLSSNKVISEVNYRPLPKLKSKEKLSFNKSVDCIERLFTNSVKSRIPSEVDFCAHLSGGIDSSSVCAIAKDYGLKEAFTVSFSESDFHNELPLAQETAKFLGLNLNIVELTQKDMLYAFSKSVYHSEGFAINGHLSATYLLNKAISKAGFKVALSGQGSDEIFMGYSHLKQDYMNFNNLINTEFPKEISYISGFQIADGESFNLLEIKKKFGFIPTWLTAKSSMAHKLSNMWGDDFKSRKTPENFLIQDFLSSLGNKNLTDYSPLQQSALMWIKYCFSGYILKIIDDAQSMAWGVENRLPFLDTALSQYAFSLPPEFHFNSNIEKHLLRTIFKNKLPSNVINKTKQSFMSSPMINCLKDKDNFDYVYAVLNNQNFLSQGIYEQNKVNQNLVLWRDSANHAHEPIMMTMMGLAHFCENFKL